MNRLGLPQLIGFIIYLLLQVLLFKNIALFHVAFCTAYIAYLLLLPVDTPPLTLLLLAFLLGFLIDIFYDSLGMHASASVFVVYVRNYWLNLITPQGGYDANVIPSLQLNGLGWFVMYAGPLVFIHQLVLFYIEAGGFGLFWFTLWKGIASSFLTLIVILIIQYIFPNKRRI